MTITVGTPIERRDKTLQASFEQSAAGATDELVADPGDGYRIVLISIIASMNAIGTMALKSGSDQMTGDMDLAAGVPWGFKGSVRNPFLECAPSEALILRTVTSAANGVIIYKVIPASSF